MSKSNFYQELNSASEITLSAKGRKSGRDIPRPVWFVHEHNTLYLLPNYGSDTELKIISCYLLVCLSPTEYTFFVKRTKQAIQIPRTIIVISIYKESRSTFHSTALGTLYILVYMTTIRVVKKITIESSKA